ncbi:MAG TPA: hypothetical protein VHN14_29160 [Kofleriaceae bacterium]|nr:hypothetical protein [Kofleriaceae bacterium]
MAGAADQDQARGPDQIEQMVEIVLAMNGTRDPKDRFRSFANGAGRHGKTVAERAALSTSVSARVYRAH